MKIVLGILLALTATGAQAKDQAVGCYEGDKLIDPLFDGKPISFEGDKPKIFTLKHLSHMCEVKFGPRTKEGTEEKIELTAKPI